MLSFTTKKKKDWTVPLSQTVILMHLSDDSIIIIM